jgi:hypothetical protein
MKFPYRKEPSLENRAHPGRQSVLRPRIRVRLKHGDKSIDLLALIDSGADDCLFPMEVAEVLGLRLDPANSNDGIGMAQAFLRPVTPRAHDSAGSSQLYFLLKVCSDVYCVQPSRHATHGSGA